MLTSSIVVCIVCILPSNVHVLWGWSSRYIISLPVWCVGGGTRRLVSTGVEEGATRRHSQGVMREALHCTRSPTLERAKTPSHTCTKCQPLMVIPYSANEENNS